MNKVKKLRYIITRECPFNCYYCHNEGMGKNTLEDYNHSMSTDDFIFFCKILKKEFGLEQVTLTGGDPYLGRDILKVGEQLKENNLYTRIISRGAPLLNILKRDIGVQLPFDCYIFSIDTLDEETFRQITRVSSKFLEENIRALKILKSQGKHVEINATITPRTSVEDIRALLKFARREKVAEMRLYEVIDPQDIKKPYLESKLYEAGLIKTSKHTNPIKTHNLVEDKGTKVVIRRCACNMAIFEKNIRYCMQEPSLAIDPQGRINMCLFLDVHDNPEVINISKWIKKRNRDQIVKCVHQFKPIHKCPLLCASSTLTLGRYH